MMIKFNIVIFKRFNIILFTKVCMLTNIVYLGQKEVILTDLKGQKSFILRIFG